MSRRAGLAALAATAALGALVAAPVATRARPGLDCPAGTVAIEAPSPAGLEEWCERPSSSAGRGRHGSYRAWYPDGRPKIEGRFADGAKDGRWTYWHGNGLWPGKGQKKEEGMYRAGRPDGRWTRWYSLGPKREEGNYKDGVREGRWVSWYELGQKAREGEYRAGQEAGLWLQWNLRGEACPPVDRGGPVPPSDDRAGVSA